jgi:HAMP domain-containing protein
MKAEAVIEIIQHEPPNQRWYTLKPHIMVGNTELTPPLGDMMCHETELEEMKKTIQWFVDELNRRVQEEKAPAE